MKEKFSEKIKIDMSAICRRKSWKVMLCSLWDWALTAAIKCEETQNKTKNPQNQRAHRQKPKRTPSWKKNDWHSLSLWDGDITVLAELFYFWFTMYNWHEWGDTENHLNLAAGLVQVWGQQYYRLIIRLLETLLALTLVGEGFSLGIKMRPPNRVDYWAWLSADNQKWGCVKRLGDVMGRCRT